jgi:uncharacterized membrane protein
MNPHSFAMVELIAAFEIIVLGAIAASAPAFARAELYFAVTVNASFQDGPIAAAVRRRYRRDIAIWSAIALLMLAASATVLRQPRQATLTAFIAPAAVTWQLIGMAIAFQRARRAVMPYAARPSLTREASLQPRAVRMPGGPLLQSGPFVLLLAAAVVLATHWRRIPARYPVHWNVDGRANGWMLRSPMSVALPLLIGAVSCLIVAIVGLTIVHARRSSSGGADAVRENGIRNATLNLLAVVQYVMAILFGAIALMPLRRDPSAAPPIILMLLPFAAVIVPTIVLMRRSRVDRSARAAASPVGDRTLDSNWKAGVFYVNRDDPAVVVEKRFGIGYTLNLGNPRAWGVLAALVAFALASFLIPRLLR